MNKLLLLSTNKINLLLYTFIVLMFSNVTLSQCGNIGSESTLTTAIAAPACTNTQVGGTVGVGPGSRKIYSGFTAGQIVQLFFNSPAVINCVQGRWLTSGGAPVGGWFAINSGVGAPGTYTTVTVPATADRLEITTARTSWVATSALLNYRLRNPDAVSVTSGANICSGATLTASGGANGTLYWHGTTASSTSTASPGSVSPAISSAGTYYFGAQDNVNTSCWTYGSTVVSLAASPTSVSAGAPQTVCSGGSVTLTGTANIPLTTFPTYPASCATSTLDTYISNVTLNGVTTSSSVDASCTNNTSVIINLNQGTAYTISITTADNSGTAYTHGVSAYIDWNADGDFTDAGELIGTTNAYVSVGTITFTFTSPTGLIGGSRMLRVVANEGATIPLSDNSYSFGETEDYTINISASLSIAWSGGSIVSGGATLTPVVNPSVTSTYLMTATAYGCSVQSSVTVTVTNPTITGTTSACVGGTSDLSAGDADWASLPTGGTITTLGTNDRVHVFNATGTFTNPQSINAQVLVVAGGGGGGTRHAGGGGAGGMIYNSSFTIPGNVSVTVGAGGAPGANGGNSVFSSLTAIGGGFGSTNGSAAGSGGSGGGGSNGAFGGAGTAGQGNKGGDQNNGLGCCAARGNGGGGAGGAGANTAGVVGSAGGVGLSNSITGTAVFYAGGGGGGLDGTPAYAGGNGGGGAGGTNTSLNGVNGTPNTGGGGGGGGANGGTSGTGGSGGSGVVIVRYKQPKWTSSNTSVATVNELTGVVTGVGPGTTTITYYSPSGCSTSTTFTVEAPSVAPTSISGGGTYCHGNPVTLTQNGGSLGTGATYQWFTGSCGGTGAGSGTSISPNPTTTTTYFVRASATTLGACPASACASTTITLPTAGTSLSTSGQNATCAVSGNNWIRFYETGSGNFIGAINPNNNLTSNVTMTSYVGSASSMDACAQPGNVLYRTAYMGRNWVITSSAVPTGSVSVLLPFTDGEMTGLTTAAGGTGSPTGGTLSSGNPNDNIDNAAGLRITKYSNPGSENGTPTDNCSAGSSIVIINSSSGNLTSAPHNYGIASAQYAIFPVSGFSEFYLHGVNNNSPLPVELISFSGTCTENGAELTWQTASESNNDYFLVQRSRDGQNWEDLTTVSGNGNSTQLINYDWLDEAGFGDMYYRLTQVDFNGDRYEKQAIFVNCESESTKLHVYPNPTQADFTVEVNSTKEVESATISIIDVTGKALVHRNVEIHSGVNTFNFGDQLESGTYLIRVRIDEEIQTLRLVVKN